MRTSGGPVNRSVVTDIQPELWLDRAGAAVAFYEAAFGATVLHRVGEGDDIVAQLAVDGVSFWVASAGSSRKRFSPQAIGGATGRTLLIVEDPDRVFEQAVGAGATAVAQVVGAQAPGQEEVAIAFVRLRPGAHTNPEDLTAFSRSRLARHKVPARFLFVDEFPTTDGPNGRKVQKARLKDMAQAALADERSSVALPTDPP